MPSTIKTKKPKKHKTIHQSKIKNNKPDNSVILNLFQDPIAKNIHKEIPKSNFLSFRAKGEKSYKIENILIYFGIMLCICGLLIIFLTFYPVAKQEIKYQFTQALSKPETVKEIKPVDPEFSIVIPKINANAKVIKNVDPNNPKIYQTALAKGVAHAAGTALPGHNGNIFIFSHSAVDWYQANRYNSIFYLINKLQKGDIIMIYYQNKKYEYSVNEKKIVDNNSTELMKSGVNSSILTLMTCWPPGTTLKRLIVIASIK